MEPRKISYKYGILIAAMLIFYFLIVRIIGLHENPILRVFNGVLMGFGLYLSIRNRKKFESENFKYGHGFKTGIMSGFIATIIFVFFMAIYMYHIDTSFDETVMASWSEDYQQGPAILLFVLFLEGLASTVVLTLAFMQKFKPSWNTKKSPQKA